MLLSVVVPAYNESEGIELFHNKHLLPALNKLDVSYEVIYVNDGSRDDTLSKLSKLAKSKSVKVMNLSRNFGKELATTAGIFQATGDAVIILDADGQHPPVLIKDFIKKWRAGGQVVIGVRDTNEKEGFIKRYGSKLFYRLFNNASGAQIVPRSTDFRLIDRVVVDEFKKLRDRNRITRGLIDWLGFKREYIHFSSPARLAGEASYKTTQLVRLAMNSFLSLSVKPLIALIWIGVIVTFISLIVGVVLIIQAAMGDPLSLHVTGSGYLSVFIAFLVGIILVAQGVVALYVSHIHEQSQDRPLFIIDPSTSVNYEKNGK